METDQRRSEASGFAQESQGWKPEGARVCANPECGHRLSESNHEETCRACQSREFANRVNRPDVWKRSSVPKGGGPLTLASLRRSAGQRLSFEHKRELPSAEPGPVKKTEAVPAFADRQCKCGREPHRGSCVPTSKPGRRKRAEDKTAAVEKAIAVPPVKPTAFADIAGKLVAAGFGNPAAGVTRVRAEDVPTVCQYRNPAGRMGHIWEELLACAPHERVKISETSAIRAGSMASQLLGKARRMGRAVEYRRDGSTLYAWLVPVDSNPGPGIMARIGADQRESLASRTEQVG